MFIYRISVNGKHYYGMDTKPTYRKSRWKTHQRDAMKSLNDNLLHTTMRKAGLENCLYEVIEEGFLTIPDLAYAEIRYISENDTYHNGLNSSPGGDGLGCHDLYLSNEDEILKIKQALSESLTNYNTNVKWAGLSAAERKQATAHLHTDSIYRKKAASLKEHYANNPELKKQKALALAEWREKNNDKLKDQNRKASLIGAEKVSKKVKVELDNGEVKLYNSKSEYAREYGHDLKYVIAKTKAGLNHKGKRAWEL